MTLQDLQNKLINLTELKDFFNLEIFRDELLNADLKGFDHYIKFTADKYYSNTLFRSDQFEIRLLCWKPLQETPKHPHPQNGCLMKILEGKLLEEKFIESDTIKTVYKKGDVSYIKASESHILKNLDTYSVSLHIYSPSGFYDIIDKQ
jgi:quercetin dioxygenase-like cupin family protein